MENALNKIPLYGDKLVGQIRKTKSGIKQLIIPGMLFEDMGITYLGPVNGHSLEQLVHFIQKAKQVEGPVLIHVLTKKGKGYEPAERHPARFHGAEPFDLRTGLPLKRKEKPSYTDIFPLQW